MSQSTGMWSDIKDGDIVHCDCGTKIWAYWKSLDYNKAITKKGGLSHERMTKCGPCFNGRKHENN